ncbi:hypothetical protein V8E36_008977 [Tilletia maclaganii]
MSAHGYFFEKQPRDDYSVLPRPPLSHPHAQTHSRTTIAYIYMRQHTAAQGIARMPFDVATLLRVLRCRVTLHRGILQSLDKVEPSSAMEMDGYELISFKPGSVTPKRSLVKAERQDQEGRNSSSRQLSGAKPSTDVQWRPSPFAHPTARHQTTADIQQQRAARNRRRNRRGGARRQRRVRSREPCIRPGREDGRQRKRLWSHGPTKGRRWVRLR